MKQRNREKKNNNNNNNHVKFDGLILEGVMKGVIISTGTSTTMTTSDFQRMKKAAAVYAASKGYEHWPGVINNMKPIANAKWMMKRPNKSEYAIKRTTKLKTKTDLRP